jgi:hypothetical protein
MNEIERAILQLHRGIAKPGGGPISHRVRAALLLLLTACSEQSADVQRLVELTGLPEAVVSKVANGMRAHGVWTNAGIDSSRWLDDAGRLRDFTLMADALTCMGETTRASVWRDLDRRHGYPKTLDSTVIDAEIRAEFVGQEVSATDAPRETGADKESENR